MKFNLKKIETASDTATRVDVTQLQIPEVQEQYSVKVQNRYSVLFEEILISPDTNVTKGNLSPEQQWQCLKQSVQEANEILPKIEKGRKKNG